MDQAKNQDTTPAFPHWKRTIAFFLSSQILSLFGSMLVQYALMWHITLTTKSGVMMTIYIIVGFLPQLILSPFGGVWADRFNRKLLMILADGGIALATLVAAIVYNLGFDSLVLLFAVAAVRAAGQAIHQPAVGAALPQLVPQEALGSINGFSATIQAVMMLITPIIAAGLLAIIPLQVIFLIDVGTAALAIGILVLGIPIPDHGRVGNTQGASHFADIKAGIKYIKEHRWLVSFFVYLAALLFLIAPAAFLTPLQTTRSFGPDLWRLTAIEIVFSVGMMVGGVLVSFRGGFKNRMHSMVVSTLIMGFCTLGLGFSGIFWIYLVFMGVFGISMPFFNGPSATLIQEHVDSDYLGRVFSVFTMISSSMMPLGMVVFGPLADQVPIELILIGTGVTTVAIGLALTQNKKLMLAGLPLPKPLESTPAPDQAHP